MIGGIRGVWEVVHKKIAIVPNNGSVGQFSGGHTQVITVGGAGVLQTTNIDPGDSVLSIPGLSSSEYRYPGDALKGVWASEPTTPYNGRWVVYKMTHGTDMQDASGTPGANYPLGDPTVGGSIRFYWSELVNTDGNTWSMELRTDSDPEGDNTWANGETHGYATDATVPSTDVGIKVWSRTPQTNTAVGMSIRMRHTSTDEGARIGRQTYLGHAWFDNESVTNGCSFWTCAVGGWQTTDHMPSSVGGNPNTDSKYDLAQAAEWLAKCVAPDSDVVYFRIQIGQNNVSSGAFAEGSGTDLGEYANNIGHILDYWRLICTAAGKTPYFYLVSTQNTIIGGARMKAMAEALRSIALANSDVGFFDLRGAVIDAGFTDGDFIMTSVVSSEIYPNRIHTNQNGMYEFATLEWGAISTASPGGGRIRGLRYIRGIR